MRVCYEVSHNCPRLPHKAFPMQRYQMTYVQHHACDLPQLCWPPWIYLPVISICGLSDAAISCCVKTVSPGRRLTRPAPARRALAFLELMPLLLERMEPASLIVSGSLKRRGGAKSRPVKVLDLRMR